MTEREISLRLKNMSPEIQFWYEERKNDPEFPNHKDIDKTSNFPRADRSRILEIFFTILTEKQLNGK